MADKIMAGTQTGDALYAHIRNSAGEVWTGSGSVFETYNASNWTSYSLALSEQGASGTYDVNFPALGAGIYAITIYEQPGTAPAEGDSLVASYSANWDGTALSNNGATLANQTTIIADIAALPTATENKNALLDENIDGTLDVKTAIKFMASAGVGKVVATDNGTDTDLDFYNFAGAVILFTLNIPDASTGRTRS